MKKHILLPFVLGLGLLFFSNSAKSQNFQIVASFGTAHNWAVPNAVLYEIDYYYPYHQIVHINREQRGRNLFYNVLLERRGQFVELFFGRHAIILDVNYYNRYPLAQHICSGHCGYHGNFYRAHQVVCNHRGHRHGRHNGHNHIAYRSGRNYNSYAVNNGAVNRNVRPSYASNNVRIDSRRSSSSRSSVARNDARGNSKSRGNNAGYIRSNSNSRTNNSEGRSNSSNSRVTESVRKPSSAVRGNGKNRSSDSKNSRSASSSSRSRN
ncbi:hypothetical protein MATR_32210 [Marivirga tractuosa]|uniref:Uncharacterized protein n=1 Tax=Marivirga tractuosa (strain ATCC 23168 / DSM 4126 / NBRC 15989 / NCIMB 1408 / VKM B-1430 / H-43) TaxID=643867 RepID=E4TSY9_MARTH|nr:hypothetical protein [Marivirga tractuosa]ADR22930.1 hypothetical protein Ftrac_2954 [Marivirga tractuosa DSM 4126]BDD16396.1 hypothetical protein MATR_32210 [Marivirga tractuosa]